MTCFLHHMSFWKCTHGFQPNKGRPQSILGSNCQRSRSQCFNVRKRLRVSSLSFIIFRTISLFMCCHHSSNFSPITSKKNAGCINHSCDSFSYLRLASCSWQFQLWHFRSFPVLKKKSFHVQSKPFFHRYYCAYRQ